jgi:hypothetical protein
LLHLVHFFGKIAIFGVGVFGGLDEKLDAGRVGRMMPRLRLVARLSSCNCLGEGAMKGCQIRTLTSSVSVQSAGSRSHRHDSSRVAARSLWSPSSPPDRIARTDVPWVAGGSGSERAAAARCPSSLMPAQQTVSSCALLGWRRRRGHLLHQPQNHSSRMVTNSGLRVSTGASQASILGIS